MGKLEEMFGDRRTAELFGEAAYGNLILRLETTDKHSASAHVKLRAVAGIACTSTLVEGSEDNNFALTISVTPVSVASYQGLRTEQLPSDQIQKTLSSFNEFGIVKPCQTEEDMLEGVCGILSREIYPFDYTFTVVTADLIRQALTGFDMYADKGQPRAQPLAELSRVALSGLW